MGDEQILTRLYRLITLQGMYIALRKYYKVEISRAYQKIGSQRIENEYECVISHVPYQRKTNILAHVRTVTWRRAYVVMDWQVFDAHNLEKLVSELVDDKHECGMCDEHVRKRRKVSGSQIALNARQIWMLMNVEQWRKKSMLLNNK